MSEKKKYGKTIAIILVVLVVIIAVLMVFRFVKSLKHEAVDTRPVITTAAPEKRTIEVYTEQIGTIMPQEYVAVIPMVTGEVLSTNFNIGDKVKEGDLLCTINYDGLEGLKIQLDGAAIQLETAQTNLKRMEALYPTGAVSEQQMEQTQAAVDAAQLQYDGAKVQYDTYVKYTSVKAPISGTIESKGVSVHDFTNPQSPICVITADGGCKISFGVNNESAEAIGKNEKVVVTAGGKEYEGKITEVGTMLSTSGLHQAEAEIVDGEDLTTGSRAKVILIKNRAADAVTIPLKAVYYSGSDAFVYVLNGDKAEKRVFTEGINDGEFVEVLEGIDESDTIIDSWSKEIYNGAEVIKSSAGSASAAAEQ